RVWNSIPARAIPVPTGALPASPPVPSPGALGLLLSWKKLFRQIEHEFVPTALISFGLGHRPLFGLGASSLFCESGAAPIALWSNSLRSMIRCPPAFVPENPSALNCPCARRRIVLQSGHAPT